MLFYTQTLIQNFTREISTHQHITHIKHEMQNKKKRKKDNSNYKNYNIKSLSWRKPYARWLALKRKERRKNGIQNIIQWSKSCLLWFGWCKNRLWAARCYKIHMLDIFQRYKIIQFVSCAFIHSASLAHCHDHFSQPKKAIYLFSFFLVKTFSLAWARDICNCFVYAIITHWMKKTSLFIEI